MAEGFDATADFLAREQAAMQQIGENIDDFGAFDSSPIGEVANNNNNNQPIDFDAGGSAGLGVGAASNFAPSDNYSIAAAPSSSSPQSIGKSSSVGAFEVLDSEAIREWKEKYEEQIKKRDALSDEKHKEILEKAQKDIQAFYAEYQAKKDKKHEKNVADQEEFIKKRDEDVAGRRWEIIAELTDGVSKGKGCKDTSRMKGMLNLLKTDPKAPGNSAH